MREPEILKNAFHFQGFSVIVPRHVGQPIEILPVDLSDQIPENIVDDPEHFSLIRVIAKLDLFSVDGYISENYENPIRDFDIPVELRIKYTRKDLRQVGGLHQRLKLAYWNMHEWVIISNPSHEYRIFPPSTAQIAEVKIWSWVGDPTLAWGK